VVVIGGGPAARAAAVHGAADGVRTLDVERETVGGQAVIRDFVGVPARPEERAPLPLETSLPGVFAAGDVRFRSPRGVAAAVADGSIAIRSVREYAGVGSSIRVVCRAV
jgi:thioredoxin reductase